VVARTAQRRGERWREGAPDSNKVRGAKGNEKKERETTSASCQAAMQRGAASIAGVVVGVQCLRRGQCLVCRVCRVGVLLDMLEADSFSRNNPPSLSELQAVFSQKQQRGQLVRTPATPVPLM